jgi:hypothetical protein
VLKVAEDGAKTVECGVPLSRRKEGYKGEPPPTGPPLPTMRSCSPSLPGALLLFLNSVMGRTTLKVAFAIIYFQSVIS